MAIIASLGVFGSFILSILTLILGKQLSKIWGAVDQFQIYSFLLFTNIDFPEFIRKFFGVFKLTRFSFLPNFYKLLVVGYFGFKITDQ